MNENRVFGGAKWLSTDCNTGIDAVQFQLFRLKTEFRSNWCSLSLLH